MASDPIETPGRLARVRFTLASLGSRRGVLETLTGKRPYEAARDRSFDEEHGTDTGGSVDPADLGIDDEERRAAAICYLPSPPRVTRWVVDHADVAPERTAFVDLGCGKGRVLLVAAERPFREIVGVDISAELIAAARRNVDGYRPPSARVHAIELVTADVTTYDLPSSDLLLHLYHPFAPDVTATVLRRLEASLAATPRQIVVAYIAYSGAVPEIVEMFGGFPWLQRTRYEASVRGHYNCLFYRNR